MKKLKIAVWHNLPSGGGKRQLYNHVRGLVGRGHYVESWCPETADQKYLPLGKIVKEHIIPLKRKSHFDDIIKPLSAVKDLVKVMNEHCELCGDEINRGDFDVLFANACMFLRTAPIARYVNLPSAIYLGEPYRWFYEALPELPWVAPHDFFDLPFSSLDSLRKYLVKQKRLSGMRYQAREELEFAKKFDLILVNSKYSRESVLRTYNLEAKVCYLGIDSSYYKPTGEEKENFAVGLGTIYHAKGIDRAIRAIGTMAKEKRPDLVWIGNGASDHDLKKYKALAKELKVHFIPRIHIPDKEVISLLSRAQVMLYTSRLEPFGLAPLEANACGTPVIGIAEGGVRETIRHEINGFLTNDDDPEMLGQLLLKFTEHPGLSHKMGMQARKYVETNWNMEMCTDNIEARLQQVAAMGDRQAEKEILAACQPLDNFKRNPQIRLGIDRLTAGKNKLFIEGWAFIDDRDAADSEIFVVVKQDASARAIRAEKMRRPDVTAHFGNRINYDNSGFRMEAKTDRHHKVRVGIAIKRNGRLYFTGIED